MIALILISQPPDTNQQADEEQFLFRSVSFALCLHRHNYQDSVVFINAVTACSSSLYRTDSDIPTLLRQIFAWVDSKLTTSCEGATARSHSRATHLLRRVNTVEPS